MSILHSQPSWRGCGIALLALCLATACSESPANPSAPSPFDPPKSRAVLPSAEMANAARVEFAASDVDSVRIHYAAVDTHAPVDTGTTPWVSAGARSELLLGLQANTTYRVWTEAKRGAASRVGDTLTYVTQSLPSSLATTRLVRERGGLLSGGYTLTSTITPDYGLYAVAFDSAGVIRWYRKFNNAGAILDVQQQTNGHITVAIGTSHGYDVAEEHFVELSRAGDSLRTIIATGSPYTDGHELLVQSDGEGHHVADYLFGYDIRVTDMQAFGGGSTDPLAGHQVLRVDAQGRVDTLVQAWAHWSPADAVIGPPRLGDFDHPNSLAFDRDSGLVISYRDLGAIVKLAPHTNRIAWTFGGTRNEFTLTGDPLGGFGGQHTVRVLSNGHLLLFDNGWPHSPQTSRAVEYALDPATRTARMVWQYVPDPPLFVPYTGSVQRLRNGNTIVTFTREGIIDEVSPTGALVSRMRLENGAAMVDLFPYRTQRIRSLYRYEHP